MSEVYSQDTQFVFLHGWGQSSQIWHQQTKYFKDYASTHTMSLPGHDGSSDLNKNDWVKSLEQKILTIPDTSNIILIGWSLGGQLALALERKLRNSAIIKGLVLVSTTPCFRQKNDWIHGCGDEIWQGFNNAAEAQNPKLMKRFFQLMLHGDILSRSDRNSIAKEAINKTNPPSTAGLKIGLGFLSNLDLRRQISNISVPTLIIHGQQDAIVPVQAGHFLTENIQSSEEHIIQDCGHAPFLTHHAEFNQILEQWWKNISV